jgi:hypothetical protein
MADTKYLKTTRLLMIATTAEHLRAELEEPDGLRPTRRSPTRPSPECRGFVRVAGNEAGTLLFIRHKG